jgi:hypothetical protein
MSIERAEQLAEFAEAGNQQRIYLTTGQLLQGWIMEITEDAVLISTGFAEKAGQDHWLSFGDIDFNRLEYWDIQAQQWQAWRLSP